MPTDNGRKRFNYKCFRQQKLKIHLQGFQPCERTFLEADVTKPIIGNNFCNFGILFIPAHKCLRFPSSVHLHLMWIVFYEISADISDPSARKTKLPCLDDYQFLSYDFPKLFPTFSCADAKHEIVYFVEIIVAAIRQRSPRLNSEKLEILRVE